MRTNKPGLVLACALMFTLARVSGDGTNDVWIDGSPHKETRVLVNGVQLQYLDWGGSGESLLFLPGLGGSAHIFDAIAPEFTNQFHVLALTRRGFGKSDKPKSGYDLDTLTDDLNQFLDALKIKRVALVGHSFGGVELTHYASRFPQRVTKLVYLDAAYDYTAAGTELLSQVDSLEPHPSNEERANYVALHDWFKRNRPGWNEACEADFADTRSTTSKFWSFSTTPNEVMDLMESEAFQSKPDYAKLAVPALAFFADHNFTRLLGAATKAGRNKDVDAINALQKWQQEQIGRFKRDVKNAQTVFLVDTDHFCFIQRQAEVVHAMWTFLKSP